MPIKTAYGGRVYVNCKACNWSGVRTVKTAKSKPCPKCKSTEIKFVDMAAYIDRRMRNLDALNRSNPAQ